MKEIIDLDFNASSIDPLRNSNNPVFGGSEVTIGSILTAILRWVFPIAGFVLFILIVWGGLQMMMGGVNGKKESAENGKKRIVAAVIGAVIVFSAYMIMIVIQAILGIDIAGI